MKNIALLLVTFICLQVIAFAVPDSVTTGPYKISFDLGIPKDAYKIEVEEPKVSESLAGEPSETYAINLIKINSTMPCLAMINIYKMKQIVLPAIQRVSVNINEVKSLGLSGVQGAVREVDGKDGVVCSGLQISNGIPETTYFADYYISENEKVLIYSGIPWDEGTLSLLKTVHIERINATT